jgi:FKBP-type peptidyl-prolyl cis-trans isomerase SlpA
VIAIVIGRIFVKKRVYRCQISAGCYNFGMNSTARVTPDSHLTLHYRLCVTQPDGNVVEIMSTFGQPPATLQLGMGALSPAIESHLVGLPDGAHESIALGPEEAFGPRKADLVQRISRINYDEVVDPKGNSRTPGDWVDVPGPEGGSYKGVLRELGEETVTLDFNHPLAGQPLMFEVNIIGIL